MTWRQVPLKRLARVSYGLGQPPPSAVGGIPVLRATNIHRGTIIPTGLIYAALDDIPVERAPLLRAGEILVVRSGAYTGDSALVTKEWEGAAPGYDLRLTPYAGTEPQFLAYQLLAAHVLHQIDLARSRAAQPHLNAEELGEIQVHTTNLAEQKRIADFLDRETARIDGIFARRQELIALLNERRFEMRRAAFAMSDGHHRSLPWLSSIPDGWQVLPLRWVTECLDRRRVPLNAEQRADMAGEIPYWGANGVVDEVDDYLFDEELVLLGEDGAPFFDRGKDVAFFVTGRVWVNNHIHVLRPLGIRPVYLTHYLNLVDYSAFITGTTRDKLTQEEMGRIPVPVPPEEEQLRIENGIEQQLSRIDEVTRKIRTQNGLLQEHRQALIMAAVTGDVELPGTAA